MKHLFRSALIASLLLLNACGDATDKYPFPPQFTSPAQVPPTVLPPPPATHSKQTQRELQAILHRQARLSDAERAAILHEDKITPAMIVTPVLGTHYTEATHPALFSLLLHSASDAWRISDVTQDYWGRTRPWLTDARVKLLVKRITRPSYPSGHTVTNHVWAHVLSDLFPAKRKALFARAYAVGTHRFHAGVHYPSDVLAGKKLASIIFREMKQSPQFRAELAAARQEIRHTPANDNVVRSHPESNACVTPEPGHTMTLCR